MWNMLAKKRREELELQRNMSSWSDLPLELLELISKRLKSSRLLTLRFRAVCKSWRACCPISPCNVFPRKCTTSLGQFNKYITKNTLYLIVELLPPSSQTSNPRQWLVMLDELNPGKFSIRHPLTKTPFSYFSKSFPKELNLLDYRVVEIAHSFTMTELFHDIANAEFRFTGDYLASAYWNMSTDKVLAVPGLDHVCFVIIRNYGWLDICNFRDDNLTTLNIQRIVSYDDVVEYKGKIVAVDRRGNVYRIEYNNGTFAMNKISRGIRGTGRRKRLVATEDDGCLFLLQQSKKVDEVVQFKVYKLDEKKGRWFMVQNLNDHVFVVGADFSASFPAKPYPGFRGNCIFAYEYSFRPYRGSGSVDRYDYFERGVNKHMLGRFDVESGGSYGDLESCDVLWPFPSFLDTSAGY